MVNSVTRTQKCGSVGLVSLACSPNNITDTSFPHHIPFTNTEIKIAYRYLNIWSLESWKPIIGSTTRPWKTLSKFSSESIISPMTEKKKP